MEFFKKRIREFQEKKLGEILSKIQFHQYMKNQAEQKLNEMDYDEDKIREEISFNEKMIAIWQRNEEKLRMQMSQMQDWMKYVIIIAIAFVLLIPTNVSAEYQIECI